MRSITQPNNQNYYSTSGVISKSFKDNGIKEFDINDKINYRSLYNANKVGVHFVSGEDVYKLFIK